MASRKYCYINFAGEGVPLMLAQTTLAAPTDADNQVNFFHCRGHYFEKINEAANSDLGFTKHALGWVIPNDATDDEGIEITQGILATGTLMKFTVGTESAFIKVRMSIPVVADYDVAFVGFRALAAYTAGITEKGHLLTAYSDTAGLNVDNGNINTITRLAAGVGTATDTTDNVVDGAGLDANSVTLETHVSTAGVVTFKINGADPTINTNTVTLTSGQVIIPTIIFTKDANGTDTPPILQTYQCGIQ